MNAARVLALTSGYSRLRVAVVGDFCLDRYLEIDPERREISIETALPVHNVVNVRSQPGAAGTILNNLAALGIGRIYPVGFCGQDGEGHELRRALGQRPGVSLEHFIETAQRRTFTYCKPLVLHQGKAPVELNRLDSKNWTPTPPELEDRLSASLRALAQDIDAFILMDQVDLPETGVVTSRFLDAVRAVTKAWPQRLIMADSRRSLRGYPPVCLKMNASELAAFTSTRVDRQPEVTAIRQAASDLARQQQRPVFVTLAEHGMVGASADGETAHVPALPLRGEIDIVGAGDAVTANLTAALAAGATLLEAVQIASVAASVVIHQLGTTGTATGRQIAELVGS